jgi:hypothetical protein
MRIGFFKLPDLSVEVGRRGWDPVATILCEMSITQIGQG